MALTKSSQLLGIIVLQIDQEFNICFIICEYMTYETITFLNFLKSSVEAGVQ